ncbi:hypothetical protein B484DRAFT_434203, partial [Ochromonadaceae sp. CCMP2298]
MADEEVKEELYQANEEIKDLKEEIGKWKAKNKTLETQKRGADIAVNKIKTELNSLRNVDKLWRQSAKVVHHTLTDAIDSFSAQCERVESGLAGVSKVGQRITSNIPSLVVVKTTIAALQKRISEQEAQIINLHSQVSQLTRQVAEKTEMVNRLSAGIDFEVERLLTPVRDKLAHAMLLVMKEKAARAQERRGIADLWPKDHLMPSVLMHYRALTDSEQKLRTRLSRERDASYALALEIRANMAESQMWEQKYDDYGRVFWEHRSTAQVEWEEPEIIQYRPPPGRDEHGNVSNALVASVADWDMCADSKGEVYYKCKSTGEVRYIPPTAYAVVPMGKSREERVSEAAQMVLDFIKEKVLKHIQQTKELRHKLENPPTPAEVSRLLKEEVRKPLEQQRAEAAEREAKEAEDAAEPLDLSSYLYDIETVEMIAQIAGVQKQSDEESYLGMQAFQPNNPARALDVELYSGRSLVEVDCHQATQAQLRGIIEQLAQMEEVLEKRVHRVRENLQDFSFALMHKTQAMEAEELDRLRGELAQREERRLAELREAFAAEAAEVEAREGEQRRLFEERARETQSLKLQLSLEAAQSLVRLKSQRSIVGKKGE